MSKFLLPSSPTNSTSRRSPSPESVLSEDDPSTLPFPKPLSRSAFTDPEHFSPHDFLTTLHNRHQALEDLRQELRTHSQEIENELVELVNRDYGDFVGLGISLQGGETRVEDLRVGLLAFRRKVEGVKLDVRQAVVELEGTVAEIGKVKKEKEDVGRLLAIDEKLRELESWLGIGDSIGLDLWGGNGEMDKLKDTVSSWNYLQYSKEKAPAESPFLKGQEQRISKVKSAILEQLGSAYKKAVQSKDAGKLLDLLALYDSLGERKTPAKISRQLKNA